MRRVRDHASTNLVHLWIENKGKKENIITVFETKIINMGYPFYIDFMVREIGETKQKKKKTGLMTDKDYITEAWLQGGKAIGRIFKPKKQKKRMSKKK